MRKCPLQAKIPKQDIKLYQVSPTRKYRVYMYRQKKKKIQKMVNSDYLGEMILQKILILLLPFYIFYILYNNHILI